MTRQRMRWWMASGLCLALIGTASAQSAGASAPQGGPPHGPPPEAIAACQGKTAGTAVSFTAHGMTMNGICQMAGNVLAARPSGGPGGPPPDGSRPPPPQR